MKDARCISSNIYWSANGEGVKQNLYIDLLPSSVQVGNFNWNRTEMALVSINPASRPADRPGIVVI